MLLHSRSHSAQKMSSTYLVSSDQRPSYIVDGTLLHTAVECNASICYTEFYTMAFLRHLSRRALMSVSLCLNSWTNTWHAMQGSRMRNTKTDYVSCPSCGRTLFDLQEVTDQIRTRTGHLPGVSIAIMGCIVNGPGEMADADFG